MLGGARELRRTLPTSDQQKLDEYLDSVRSVERRIAAIEYRQKEAALEKAGLGSSKRHASDSPPIEIKIPEGEKRSEYMQVMCDLNILARAKPSRYCGEHATAGRQSLRDHTFGRNGPQRYRRASAGLGRCCERIRWQAASKRCTAADLTALVGREEEIELLLRRWSRAKTAEGQVVLLSGEAGIGKSRLMAALLERIATDPHTLLHYFCSAHYADSALYPIIGQMKRAAGFAYNDSLQTKLDKLDGLLARTSTSIQDAALFAEMLRFPTMVAIPNSIWPHSSADRERSRHSLPRSKSSRGNVRR